MREVIVKYTDYSVSPVVQEIEFELAEDTILRLKLNSGNESVAICMADAISENTELEGSLDYEALNTLIRSLSQLRNQIKAKKY